MVHACAQKLCQNGAAYSFVWPGQPRALICAKHFRKLVEVAMALNLPVESLDVQQLSVAGDAEQ